MPGTFEETSLVIRRSFRRSIRALAREGTLVSVLAAFFAGALLLHILLVLFLVSARTERLLAGESAIHLDLLPGATAQETQEFFAAVRHLPSVSSALYITKEQALEDARTRDPGFVAFLEEYRLRNPFADTILVRLRTAADYAPFSVWLRTHMLARILDPAALAGISFSEQQMQTLTSAVALGRVVLAVLLALAIAGLLVVCVEFVRRKQERRRDEGLLEHLVGATLTYALLPVAMEVGALLIAVFVMSSTVLFLLAGFFPHVAAPLFLVQTMDVAVTLGILFPVAILLASAAAGVSKMLSGTHSLSPV